MKTMLGWRTARLSMMTASPIALAVIATPALAQAEVKQFDIPAESLSSAILEFSRQSDVLVVVSPALTNGKRSKGIRGAMPVNEAIGQLLRGTSLRAVPNPSGGYRIDGDRPVAPAKVSLSAGEAASLSGATQTETPTQTGLGEQAATPSADGDIMVTARKRNERALDVPIALTAISGTELDQRGIGDIAQVVKEVPGVGIYDNGNGRSNITIRGVSSLLGSNPNGYYLDDLPFTGLKTPIYPDVRAWDLDRIEVLRGPQGTLFGEGSVGGTIRVLTRGADLDNWEGKGYASISGTKDGGENTGLKGAVNVPIIPGMLAVRVAGTTEKYDGWIDDPSTGTNDVNPTKIDTFRIKARFDPTSRLSITGSYWSFKNNSVGSNGANATDAGNIVPGSILNIASNYKTYGATARYDLGFGQIFYGFSQDSFKINQGGSIPGLGRFDATINVKVRSHELRLASSGNGPLTYTVGAYKRDVDRGDSFSVPALGLDQVSSTESRAYAFFGEATYALFDKRLDLTAGLRYFHENLTNFAADNGIVGPTSRGTFKPMDKKFIVAWHPNTNSTVYVSAASGSRSGQNQATGVGALAAQSGVTLPDMLSSDSIWTYELGAKVSLLDRRLDLEGAIYHSNWKDVVVSIPIGSTGLSGLINSNGTHTDGVEASLVARPTANFTLNASGAYTAASYVGAPIPGTLIVAGTHVADVPRWTSNVSGSYDFDVTSSVRGWAYLGWNHNSARPSNAVVGSLAGDAIDSVNLRLNVIFNRFTLGIFTDNLTNDRGAVGARTIDAGIPGPAGISAIRTRPRTIGIDLNIKVGGPAR